MCSGSLKRSGDFGIPPNMLIKWLFATGFYLWHFYQMFGFEWSHNQQVQAFVAAMKKGNVSI